jgi:glycerate 2-kinase
VLSDPKSYLLRLFRHSIAAVDPRLALNGHWPPHPLGRLIVIGAGKAAASMAQAAESHYGIELEGLVVTRDGYARPTRSIEVIQASHPVPDHRSAWGAERILSLAASATADDLVLCLWSGGASAVMVAPAAGLSFVEKQRINTALLASGATIAEINSVRKHLSAIKGGRLALACGPAQVVSLIISDVVGDDPSVIASGPTVVDPTTCADALAVLRRYHIPISAVVEKNLEQSLWESPKALGVNVRNTIVARPRDCFHAAANFAAAEGVAFLDLGDHFDGSVDDVAAEHAARIRAILDGRVDLKPPCLVVSGGEAVVRVTGQGRGGPNTEFCLALAQQLQGASGVYALACDSDGTDGKGSHAGAFIGPDTLQKARSLGLDVAFSRANNDTACFFEALGDLIVTGPTYNNVNDFRAVLMI